MTENKDNSNPTPNPTPTPTPDPKPGEDKNSNDSVALAKRVGELEKIEKEYNDYRGKVDPVLETLYSDSELFTKATEVHNRRLGIKTDPKKTDDGKDKTTPVPPVRDNDTRMAMVNQINTGFESKVGIDKLDSDKQKEVRGAVGVILKELLDPNNNKSITQVFEEVSLQKLPWYLEKAYEIVNRNNDLAGAREEGKNEILKQYEGDAGVTGNMTSSSVPLDQVGLTAKEKVIARNMNISEEDYLKNKKEILAARQA